MANWITSTPSGTYGDPFSTRRPATLVEAFERSILNGDRSFSFEGVAFFNTMPGMFLQVVGEDRVVKRLSSLNVVSNFFDRRVAAAMETMPSYVGSSSLRDSSHIKTAVLTPFVIVSQSDAHPEHRHFTLYFADRHIDGTAHFNPIVFDTSKAQAFERSRSRAQEAMTEAFMSMAKAAELTHFAETTATASEAFVKAARAIKESRSAVDATEWFKTIAPRI